MLSVTFEKRGTNKLLLMFDKISAEYRVELIKRMSQHLNQHSYISYIMIIDGLEGTIDNLLKEMKSKNYTIIDNGKFKRFIKHLPTLCLYTDNYKDLEVFESYMGAFNEGSMSLFLMKSIGYDIKSESDSEEVIKYANANSFIQIDVTSDGNVLEIKCCDVEHNISEICQIICNFMLTK